MPPITQQRLIGSILLICALGVVAFLLIDSANNDVKTSPNTEPDIPFVSSIDAIRDENIKIVDVEPEALIDVSELESEPEPEVDTPVKIAHQQKLEVKPTAKASKINPVSESQLKKADSNSTMWSLQIASLADHSAAIALTNKVNNLGYKALVEKAETSKGIRFRVRIGPEKNKQVLEKIAKTLEKELKLTPLLLKQ
ncbi:MAG: SPOR domain-containing protein [Gammaproteobacteria bacterium]|nr:SPOR domain-containing protein [Gammaproteobacteria bacterium]